MTADEYRALAACSDGVLRLLGAISPDRLNVLGTVGRMEHDFDRKWYAHHRRAVALVRAELLKRAAALEEAGE